MDIRDFKAGRWIKQYRYKSFQPEAINHEWVSSDPSIASLLADANRKLGELNAFGQLVPNVDYFIQMHVTKEATASSSIEGTQTTIEEALVKAEDLDLDLERRDDWLEVTNYIRAMNQAIEELSRLPLSTRLLRRTHKVLLSSGRGKSRQPGELRTSQNWIGPSLRDAVFVPPTHTEVPNLLSDLEQFLHNDKIFAPQLLKIAIAHYQFETIHPFLDGNGRLGRLLITLYLVSSGLLEKPTLYLSAYFEKNRRHYYDYLMAVRTRNDLASWTKFMLAGIIETSERSIETFKKILILRAHIEREALPQLGKRSSAALRLMQYLYLNPIVKTNEIQQFLNVSPKTANSFVADFVRLGILEEKTGFRRNRIFTFHEYISIFQN